MHRAGVKGLRGDSADRAKGLGSAGGVHRKAFLADTEQKNSLKSSLLVRYGTGKKFLYGWYRTGIELNPWPTQNRHETQDSPLGRLGTGRHFLRGLFRIGRGGWSWRQGGNTDFIKQGDETG